MSLRLDVAERPARILIVDDELHDRRLLEVMLKPEGFLLTTAASGEEALAMVAKEAPDLIVLDVMMPEMDGYQVAGRIKGNLATKNIPVIMLTVLDDHTARMLGLGAGAEDFLTKPVDRAELCVRVRNLLRLKAYGAHFDKYSQVLEGEAASRTADLRDEQDRSQRYLDTAAVIMLALDPKGRVTLANRFACSVLGWTEAELLGRDWFDTCLVPHIRDQVRGRFDNLLRGSNVSAAENTILTRTGEERRIEWRSTVLRDDAGRVTGTFSSGTDITERHLAVEALRMAEERMRFALEAAGVGIWDMDLKTGTLRWSEILESHYGLKPGTFGGTFDAFVEGVHPEDRAGLLGTMEKASRSGSDFSTQHRALWPDGTVRWLSGAGRIHLGEQGQAVRGVGISQDVTERRTLERQYLQAQKMEAVGRLASGVAHDFNNLLTVILTCAELVTADAAVLDRHGDDLGEIIKAALRARGLTKQLLAFGRQQVLLATPLDLNGLVTDMTGMLGRLIGKNIEVTLVLAPNLSLAFADRGQIEQVLMNLVVNARDAMPDGGCVTIETSDVELESSSFQEETVMDGDYVMLAITDTGAGMTKETQRRLFEPFYTTKEVGKGTGLGLSTTYGIVKQSKGYIWVHSELGQGTTFKVYLPRSKVDAPVPAVSQVVTAPLKSPSETVLLCEHEARVRRLSNRILDNAGYRVLEAANGGEAERILAQHSGPIHLFVTNLVMPDCGGSDLFRRLQARAPGLRVLYMSGHTNESAVRKAGIDRGLPFVQKPFTGAELVRRVREALDRPD